MTTELWPSGPAALSDETEARNDAARRPFECELPGTPEEFAAMVQEGERQSWPEVVRAGMYGLLRHAAEPEGPGAETEIATLLERAALDGDFDMLALGLAWRAWVATARGLDMGAVPDDDLAKAVVILESTEGNPVIRATAHFRLAFSFMQRNLWELADEQFAAAEVMVDTVDPFAKDPLLHRAALAYNRVMVQVDWGCAVREVSGPTGARARREAQEELLAAADCVDMPAAWRQDLRTAALILDVVAGAQRVDDVQESLDALAAAGAQQMWAGHFHLARSLNPEVLGLEAAAEAADQAIEMIDSNESRAVYDLALYQATVLEAAIAGRRTAGLRSAQELASQRETGRAASVAAMRAVIASERLRKERDLLARHAYVDPLTGLENRRGFDRHVKGLQTAEVEQVAVLLFDVDHFKLVNDNFGHAAGDTVLRRVSDVLTENVRAGDFAARVGGDEFVLLLADSNIEAAGRRRDAIASEIAEQMWRDVDPTLRVTVSAGVAAGPPVAIEALGRQADAALYRAKAARGLATSA